MEELDRRRWLEAVSFEDIGELTSLWIAGKISYHPFYDSAIDEETEPLVETLAEFNRKGYITTFSQPPSGLSPENE